MRTSPACMPSIFAICRCVQWVLCDADQISARSCRTSAIEHDGPIEPCVCTGYSYVASIRFAADAITPAASPSFIGVIVCFTAVFLTVSYTWSIGGSPDQSDHLHSTASMALIGPHSVLATTPTKLPLTTVVKNPGILRAALSSIDSSVPFMAVGRT